MSLITKSLRVKRTPFTDGVEKAGVKAYTVYNHTLLATEFDSLINDYHHLKQHVQIWDVSCQKQLRVKGADAKKLIQLISPREISKTSIGQCFYVPLIDQTGGILNDPVILNISSREYWISIADSDYIQYLLGISGGLGLDVEIDEPAIYPLAVQGPKSEELISRVFGPEVRNIGFFRFSELEVMGTKMIISRSGYSKQTGFEVYVPYEENCMPLWDLLMSEGKTLNVRIGCPNLIERIESGLLSYGNDINRSNTPFEAGLGKLDNSSESFIGKQELLKRPFQQIITPVAINGEIPPCDRAWPVYLKDQLIGQITSAAYSPDFQSNVAIGMIKKFDGEGHSNVEIETQIGTRSASLCKSFWN